MFLLLYPKLRQMCHLISHTNKHHWSFAVPECTTDPAASGIAAPYAVFLDKAAQSSCVSQQRLQWLRCIFPDVFWLIPCQPRAEVFCVDLMSNRTTRYVWRMSPAFPLHPLHVWINSSPFSGGLSGRLRIGQIIKKKQTNPTNMFVSHSKKW